MKEKGLMLSIMGLLWILFACKNSDNDPIVPPPPQFDVTTYPSKAISKTQSDHVYVHFMPWFESPQTSSDGKWGAHWTMANKNPNVIVDAATGKRQIASHYYPLTGPYASSDKDIIEYQLLLMKLSGIDGVLIDWYSTLALYDYPANLKNTERFISLIDKVGLKYAIVYEDQVMNNVSEATAKITQAKADMTYMKDHYFSSDSYIKIDDKPLLMDFGPQVFHTPENWTDIFSVLSTKPTFLTLWYQSNNAGTNAAGEFSWVYQDGTPHLTHLDNFYASTSSSFKMGSAYPGFNDFYTDGGWPDNVAFTIDYNNKETFKTTLSKAIDKVDYIQLVTWNDYGEGTMIEPTQEFGYGFLTALQTTLGVANLSQNDLELVAKLYAYRKKFASTSINQSKLDQVFYYVVSLQMDKATELINTIQ